MVLTSPQKLAPQVIRISARISDLARLQAYQVGEALKKKFPGLEVNYQFRKSLGDINLQDPLWKMPEKGVFTEDFLKDLLQDETDLVVHSWKDLPTEKSNETEIVATLPRADQRDLLLMKHSAWSKSSLKIFSSSPRREYNLSACLPDLLPWDVSKIEFHPVRGNVQTRVKKWKEDQGIDGLVVAKAAMDRLLTDPHPEFQETQNFLRQAIKGEHWMALPLSVNPTAAAQGALAVEIHRNRTDLKEVLAAINDQFTFDAVGEERRILKRYGGGCHQKIGVSYQPKLNGAVLSLQGQTDAGEKLNEWSFTNRAILPKFKVQELGSLQSQGVIRKASTSMAEIAQIIGGQSPVGLWVARGDAWPATFNKQINEQTNAQQAVIWTAGLQTWKKLAAQGIWVYGTSDGLGEELPQVAHLGNVVNQHLEWYKLTHQQSEVPSQMRKLVTYEINFASEDIQDLAGKKMIYWRSTSQFKWVTGELAKAGKKLTAQYFACGPGSTYEFLKTQMPAENIFVFLSEREWREKCQI